MRISKQWRFCIGLITLWALFPAAMAAQQAPPKLGPRPAPKPPAYSSVRGLPNAVTLATHRNGLTVIVQENHVAPVATVRCYVKNTGSAFEGRYLGAGVSHVLEHVVSGGTTTRRTEEEIETIIDRFGGAKNAFTSTGMTAYFINCPAKDTMMCIDLMSDSMQHVAFEPTEFERELKVVRQELSDGEVNRRRVQFKLLGQTIYIEHPARHPVIGYLDVLNGTTNESIVDFYRQRYVPNNQVFVVVGDVQTQAVLDEIDRHWADTPRGRETLAVMPDEPAQLAPREAVREMDGSTYDVALAWPTVKLSHPDLYALDVAAYILAAGDSSRLVRSLKYDKQLVLSVTSASSTPSYVNGWFGVFAAATDEHWQAATDEILREVYRLRDEPVSPVELEKAKKQKAAELVFGQQTVQQAADSLGRSFIATGDPLFEEHYVRNIQKVTAEQIHGVARRYFRPDRLNRVIVAPPGGAPKQADELAGGAEGQVKSVRLDNGLRVLLKRHSHLPMVTIQAYIMGASLVDTPETAGRSGLVAAMLDKGTAGRSAREIAEFFDSIGGRFGASAGRSTVYATATCLSDDFPEVARLFAECFTRPSFPADEFQNVKTLALGAIARRKDSPRGEVMELFYDSLPAGSPYHINQGGKVETIEPLTVDDLRAYHTRYFVPQNMLVAVFGDIDPDAALKMVGQHFGQLKPAADFQPINTDRDNAIPKTIIRHKQTGKPTGMVMLGYQGTSIRDKEDYAAMILLDAITSGYSYPGGWLHKELRGEGLVYYVHAFQMTGLAPGFFAVMSQTQPNTTGEVVERIQKNIARAKAGEISEEDFRTAQEQIIALHAQENTSIGSQAQQAALDELYGFGHDYDKTFDARIQAVTREDVVRVARKYLNNYVQITASPAAE
jgi:zinc protease